LKFLPPIEIGDSTYGSTYSERAKLIGRYFREQHQQLSRESETPDYFRRHVIRNFVFKGPVLEWYCRIKLRLEKNYNLINSLVPEEATILDLGCGYGFLCYMLQFVSNKRKITGVDHDETKIAIAKHGYHRTDNLHFECSDIRFYPMRAADVIILTDVLHYLTPVDQQNLLNRSAASLNSDGIIILREGVTDAGKRHFGTVVSEFFSVRLLGFNKSANRLNFISRQSIEEIATELNMKMEALDDGKSTSNATFVLRKK
jgi:SAM-dependent methyltransferase